MKIDVFEKICNVWGGYYEYEITKDGNWTFVKWRTCRYTLFPDEFKKITRKAKTAKFELQYITCRNEGVCLEFEKRSS